MTRTTVPVPLAGGDAYEIMIGPGLLEELPEILAARCPAAHYAVITDSSVQTHYGDRVVTAIAAHAACTLHAFPAGEWNKTRETWSALSDALLHAHVGRDAAVVALGGGVVGDVAGFVAATYLRGIPYVHVPTSLLAMIDSSIGGKTGVDVPAGKNLVGAFHQPRTVVADLTTLATLPPPQLAAGMAEALKHGAIADARYFDQLVERAETIRAGDADALFDVVRRSVEIKAQIVTEDTHERGVRGILNFGHTVAHALETVCGYELLHGEAVALGMVAEARLGAAHGVTHASVPERLRAAIEAFELPLDAPERASSQALLEVMRHDKKVRGGSVRFALVEKVGTMARAPSGEWTIEVPESTILATLELGE